MRRKSIRERREAIGMSLRELGRRTTINPGRLSIIERGVDPSPDEAERIEMMLFRAELAKGRKGE